MSAATGRTGAPEGGDKATANVETHFKVLLLGDSNVGKTSLLRRYTDESESSADVRPTIGMDFRVRTVCIGNHKVTLHIWDTAGQERFKSITSSYFRGADGALLVYDASNRASFTGLGGWLKELNRRATEPVVKVLVANKVDLSPLKVLNGEGITLANAHNMSFTCTSAVTGRNVTSAFYVLAQRLVEESAKLNSTRKFPDAGDGPSFESLDHDSLSGVLQLGRTFTAKVRRLCDFV
ncbi:RAS small GTpases RIC1/ypt1-like [Tropilaelaps mercedesae]|uniref:RAS small GTpases RIC1/ypt1-like n=1 Tax=Tropilaelaps mercedesae TaxID=418985 RepID=A0A1V9XFT3_9ACAR|nr:RAS small GTpases RIC1/ypt1-like [Tropilaelaps mercedesae]